MHRLLKRQIKKYLAEHGEDESLGPFLAAVNEAYEQNERELSLIDRSLELTSTELSTRNETLRKEVDKQLVVQNELKHSLAALNATFDATGEAILAISEKGSVTKFNQMAAQLVNIDILTSPKISLLKLKKVIQQFEDRTRLAHKFRQIKNNPMTELYGQIKLIDGRFFEYHTSPQVENNEVLGRVWCFRDISELKRNEAMVQHQAFHDALTGLPNRALLDDRLSHGITYCNRFDTQLSVLFIDLDDFKKVNDNAGHQAGDAVLKEVTQRIKTCIRDVDTLARLGGDEFVVLLENLQESSISTVISHRIIDALVKPFLIEDSEFYISSSIGISMYPKDGMDTDELLRKADMAMYHAKAMGKNNHQYFDSELERSSIQQLQVENHLRDAISNQEFQLYYQPKVDLKNNKVIAVEALLRWKREGANSRPDIFIPVAEQTGLINDIGLWVLEEACRDIRNWIDKGLTVLPVAINVSPVEFRNKKLVAQFKSIISKFAIPPSAIEIEITESLFLDNIAFAKDILQALRDFGITVAVDDFGTGYSSLQYLHQLPIDILKIDKSFILELSDQPHNAAIADSIINLAHNLNLKVVAEGIENQASLSFLKHRGCDIGQGFFLYKPMPGLEFQALLERHN
ncbi:sensor domain-containing protein [Psychrosphaera aestuarii]|uniref:sensor domain-containing protein n=1 Tax=Psychrosphaera aestuarii TaxID=1266052 RepID=UPI001B342FBD|nr:EAL domain-containing protein [Psychrosphaera aestuarii]